LSPFAQEIDLTPIILVVCKENVSKMRNANKKINVGICSGYAGIKNTII
jgi:hypothetical protein